VQENVRLKVWFRTHLLPPAEPKLKRAGNKNNAASPFIATFEQEPDARSGVAGVDGGSRDDRGDHERLEVHCGRTQ